MTVENIPIMGRGEEASLEQVCAIPLPKETSTYTPVPNNYAYDSILTSLLAQNWTLSRQGFKLTQNGSRVLSKMEFKREDQVALIAWANSYNKSLSFIFGSGLGLEVCTNGMFDGADVFYNRRHQGGKNLFKEIEAKIQEAVNSLPERLEQKKRVIFDMQNCEISFERGCHALGEMAGKEIISSRVFGAALKEWRKPRFQEFSDSNVWCLYNACTWALQQKDPSEFHSNHISVDKFIKERVLEVM